jgi:hypothetical protein
MNALLRSLGHAVGPVCLVAALGLPGCGDDKKPPVVDTDAGTETGPQKPVLDRKLAAAVKAAESAQASSGAKGGGDGPPESGFFGPGLADKAQAPGAPPKVEVIGNGGAPRFQLVPAPADEQRVTVSITQKTHQGGGLQIEYGLSLKLDKPKDDKDKKDDKKADAPKGWRVAGKIASVGFPPGIPRELSDKLGKLKGVELRYAWSPATGVTDVSYGLPKDFDPALVDAVLRSLADAVAVAVPPVPQDPLGLGAYWMVTDRTVSFGLEVVRYRVYKVEKIDKDGASLSLDVREYATKEDADLGGQKMTLLQFQGPGKGKLDWTPSAFVAPHAELTQRTALAGTVPGGQQGSQQGSFQADVVARFTADEKKK